jgi:hypothetical protein
MKPHLSQDFPDFIQRLAAETRSPRQLGLGLLHKLADVDNVVVLETVRRPHREFERIDFRQERRIERWSSELSRFRLDGCCYLRSSEDIPIPLKVCPLAPLRRRKPQASAGTLR